MDSLVNFAKHLGRNYDNPLQSLSENETSVLLPNSWASIALTQKSEKKNTRKENCSNISYGHRCKNP